MQTQSFNSPDEEFLSALADGELNHADCADALRLLGGSPQAASQWNTYHLIGDALRSAQASRGSQAWGADPEFLQRLGQRLANEKIAPTETAFAVATAPASANIPATVNTSDTPTVMSAEPVRDFRHALPDAVGTVNPLLFKDAANEGVFRWKMLAGFACMGTVATLAWSLVGTSALDGAAQLAQFPTTGTQQQVVVASPQGPVVRDARLQELLAAHRQMGGTSLPVPSGFVRNANFENQSKNSR